MIDFRWAIRGIAALLLPTAALAQPVVRTDAGQVSGKANSEIDSFLGIPFAQPPVGQLRWRAPQPVTPWQGVRPAEKFGKSCVQPPSNFDT